MTLISLEMGKPLGDALVERVPSPGCSTSILRVGAGTGIVPDGGSLREFSPLGHVSCQAPLW